MLNKLLERRYNFYIANEKIKSIQLDNEFNNIIDYINDYVLPELKIINSGRIIGSTILSKNLKFFLNVGDGTYKIDTLDNSFLQNSISLTKLEAANANSILASDNIGNISFISNSASFQTILYRKDSIRWAKLNSDNFEDKSITGAKVKLASLTINNLPKVVQNSLIFDNSLTNIKFTNNSITNSKIDLATISETNLTADSLDVWKNNICSNFVPNDFLDLSNVNISSNWDNTLGGYQGSGNDITLAKLTGYGLVKFQTPYEIPILKFMPFRSFNLKRYYDISAFNKKQDSNNLGLLVTESVYKLEPKHFKPNSIDAKRLLYKGKDASFLQIKVYPTDINEFMEDGCIGLEHLTPIIRQKLLAA